jgi:archaellum component FlaF (FlaF/FlaG flagellin family)
VTIPMSNAIVALVVIALMLTAALTWSQTAYTSFDSVSQALKQTTQVTQEVSRTNIEVVNAQTQGGFVQVSVLNSGEVHLSQFDKWDVLVQYYDASNGYHISDLTYTENSSPGDGQWSIVGIYTDQSLGQKEVFEPGILDPGEVMLMRLRITPLPGVGTINFVTVSSANGVAALSQFNG